MLDKSLFTVEDLSDKQLAALLEQASSGTIPSKSQKSAIALCFLENSTRTRLSFERASQIVGRDLLDLCPEHSSFSKGESLEDTLGVLADYGVTTVIWRAKDEAILQAKLPEGMQILNAGLGALAHPTQALLDASSLLSHLGEGRLEALKGKRMLIVGDLANSRVLSSWLRLAPRLSMELLLVSPQPWKPACELPSCSSWQDSLPEALEEQGIDFVMALRVQHERHSSEHRVDPKDYAARFQLSEPEYLGGRPLLHPGPTNWGVELAVAMQEYPQSLLSLQRRQGLALRSLLLA